MLRELTGVVRIGADEEVLLGCLLFWKLQGSVFTDSSSFAILESGAM